MNPPAWTPPLRPPLRTSPPVAVECPTCHRRDAEPVEVWVGCLRCGWVAA